MTYTIDTLPEALREKVAVDAESGCWIGTAAPHGDGYRRVMFEGRRQALHRLAYALTVGPIPEGYVLDHLCAEKACCNPAHLEAVTVAENTRRANKGKARPSRPAPQVCKRGHDQDVHRIRDGRCGACVKLRSRGDRERKRARKRVASRMPEGATPGYEGGPIPSSILTRIVVQDGQASDWVEGPCWVWIGAQINGYGNVRLGGRAHQVHRFTFAAVNGPIPEGMVSDHVCGHRACCNPRHLRVMEHAENVRRGNRAVLAERLGLGPGDRIPDSRERQREASRKYYAKNAEKLRAKTQKWRDENPDRVKEWNAKNAEKKREYSRRYVAKNRDRVNEKKREYRARKRLENPH